MAEVWTPGRDGESLAPPGFKPKKRIVGHPDYVLDHPTRYRWAKHVVPLVRKLYRGLGGASEVHINTYVYHPPYNEKQGILRDYQMYMFDVWNGGGRGDPIDRWKGDAAVSLVWNDPGEPFLWYYIYRGFLYNRRNNFEPEFFAEPSDTFNFHGDHPHFSFLKPGGVYF